MLSMETDGHSAMFELGLHTGAVGIRIALSDPPRPSKLEIASLNRNSFLSRQKLHSFGPLVWHIEKLTEFFFLI